MKRNWTEIARGDVPAQSAGMRASLNPKGVIRLSQTTHQRMGGPEAVQILFDAADNTIGLKPTSPSMKNAYRLLRRGRGRRELYALKMVNEVGLIIPETIEFPHVEIDTPTAFSFSTSVAPASRRTGPAAPENLTAG